MYRARMALFRWTVNVAAALILWRLHAAPALAGNDSNLTTIHHAVAAGTTRVEVALLGEGHRPDGRVNGTCTSGTGKYAGIQCSSESTASTKDGVHFISGPEFVSTK